MRYVIAKEGSRPVDPAVAEMMARELSLGLTRQSTFGQLKGRIEESRDHLTVLLKELKDTGKSVVGYGATSKSTTMTNYCGIGPDLIDFISDTTPTKQGKYSPGTHIPVLPYERFCERYPDYALLLAWNHAEEIVAKEQDFLRQGGRFITFVPNVGILN
jgi:methylation protein EvaC